MALFQKSVQNDYLNRVQDSSIKEYWEYYDSYFNNPEKQKLIEQQKERKFYSEFIDELFVNCLGYTKKIGESQNYFIEEKNETDSGKADGAVKVNGEVVAVMEFKDTTTKNLKDVESQAFGYKNTHPKCNYIVTCNFKELWFYIGDTTSKEPFNLFNLSYDGFKLLWLCLSYESISTNLPEQIKNKSVTEEEEITKKLYSDYSLFRNEIFNDLVNKNPQFDKLLLFKKTQKLLDRFLFIFFAEDRLLLPTNSIAKIIKKWEDDIAFGEEKSLYTTFVFYFNLLNKGRPASKEREEIFAYNGGLFAPDEILDSIVIDDELLSKHTKKLSSYDFISDVSVNILGHIFEHSLSQIEEIQNEIAGIETDKSISKRKKDGVFYTPAYITKYIVENTVGKLCKEKREELEFNEAEFAKDRKGRQKITLKKLSNQLDNYREWLLGITICDPACGSGAFLVEALNFLIDEHKYIDELRASLFGESIQFSDITASILENNLYGVDINDESVEIAKLSLWLRTAQKGRKLTSLSSNLKCGNSLIDDPEVAGDKAFNWENEFPEVFAKGGFDVIIGNPPYVRQELFKEIKPFLEANYECYNSVADLYTYFIEKGILLMNKNGVFSFILPNKFLKATYGKQIRNVIKKYTSIELLFDFDDYPVFADATTYPIIYVFNKNKDRVSNDFNYSEISKRSKTNDPIFMLESKTHKVSYKSLKDDMWSFESVEVAKVLEKIKTDKINLISFVNKGINRGVLTGKNEVFIFDKERRSDLVRKGANAEIIKPILLGGSIRRYNYSFNEDYLLFTRRGTNIEEYPIIKEYLQPHYEFLRPRNNNEKTGRKAGPYKWFEIQDNIAYYEDFEAPKIIYPRTNNQCNFHIDYDGHYLSDNNFYIKSDDKNLLGILNSKVVFFYLMNVCTTLQGGYYDFRKDKVEKIPIPQFSNELEKLVDEIININSSLNKKINRFIKRISSSFETEKLSKKLQSFYDYDFKTFLAELKKKKIKLSLSQQDEWEEYFDDYTKELNQLQSQINEVDKEIDQMVYELYGLTPEEIEIVENATK